MFAFILMNFSERCRDAIDRVPLRPVERRDRQDAMNRVPTEFLLRAIKAVLVAAGLPLQ